MYPACLTATDDTRISHRSPRVHKFTIGDVPVSGQPLQWSHVCVALVFSSPDPVSTDMNLA